MCVCVCVVCVCVCVFVVCGVFVQTVIYSRCSGTILKGGNLTCYFNLCDVSALLYLVLYINV